MSMVTCPVEAMLNDRQLAKSLPQFRASRLQPCFATLIAIMLMLAEVPHPHCQDDLLQEMRRAYGELRDAPFVGNYVALTKLYSDKESSSLESEVSSHSGKISFIFRTITVDDGSEEIKGLNSQYGFALKRDGRSGPWYVVKVAPRATATDYLRQLESCTSRFSPRCFQHDWTQMVNAATFQIKSSTIQKDGEDEILTIQFEVGPEDHPTDDRLDLPTIRNGTAQLLRNHYFVPIHFEFDITYSLGDSPAAIVVDYEYDLTSARYPLRRRANQSVSSSGQAHERSFEYAYDRIEVEPEFKDVCLSAFGLEEPSFTVGGHRWVLLMLAFAIVLMTIGVFVQRQHAQKVAR